MIVWVCCRPGADDLPAFLRSAIVDRVASSKTSAIDLLVRHYGALYLSDYPPTAVRLERAP